MHQNKLILKDRNLAALILAAVFKREEKDDNNILDRPLKVLLRMEYNINPFSFAATHETIYFYDAQLADVGYMEIEELFNFLEDDKTGTKK